MEAVAAASSILAIIELTVNVTVWCARYARDVARAPEEITLLSQEAGTLAVAIARLQGPNIPEEARERLRPAFKLCTDDLKGLEEKLKPAKNVVERLAWPFKKRDEVKEAIGKIQRHTALFNAAVVVDLLVLAEKISAYLKGVEAVVEKVAAGFETQEREKLLDWLRTVDFESNHVRNLSLLQPDTGQWFTQSTYFLDWLKSSSAEKKHIWLCGQVGVGKSVLLSSVINECKTVAALSEANNGRRTRRIGVAYFYFDFRDQAKQLSRNMLLTLISQLHFTDSHLMRVNELRMKYPIQNSIPILELVNLLLEISGEFDRAIILIDALDECEDTLQLYDVLKAVISDKSTNKTIQILVSSRDEIAIQQALSVISFERYPLSPKSIHHDLESYIHEQVRVDSTRRFTRFPDTVKSEIVAKLCSQSQGMFQWAQCQLDELSRQFSLNDVRDALSNLPKTLTETYRRIFDRMTATERKWARRIMLWLSGARSPMTLGMVTEAIVMNLDDFTINDDDRLFDPNHILEVCRSLVSVHYEEYWFKSMVVNLAHFSVRQYLESTDAQDFYLPSVSVDQTLALACLKFSISEDSASFLTDLDKKYSGKTNGSSERPRFLGYCATAVLHHISSNDLESKLRATFLEQLGNTKQRQNYYLSLAAIRDWGYSAWASYPQSSGLILNRKSSRWLGEGFLPHGSCIVSATAELGLWQLCWDFIQAGIDIEFLDDDLWAPICFLAASGANAHSKEILRKLGSREANPGHEFPCNFDPANRWLRSAGSALMTAVVAHNDRLVDELFTAVSLFVNSPTKPQRDLDSCIKLFHLSAFLAGKDGNQRVLNKLGNLLQECMHMTDTDRFVTMQYALRGCVECGHSSCVTTILESPYMLPCHKIAAWKLDRCLLVSYGGTLKAANSAWLVHCVPELSLKLMDSNDNIFSHMDKAARINLSTQVDPEASVSEGYHSVLEDVQAFLGSKRDESTFISESGGLEKKQEEHDEEDEIISKKFTSASPRAFAESLLYELPTATRRLRLNHALFDAIKRKVDPRVLEIILLAGADPNAETVDDASLEISGAACEISFESEEANVTQRLLEDVSLASNDQSTLVQVWTPLMVACYQHKPKWQSQTISLLLEHGANPIWKIEGVISNPHYCTAAGDGRVGSPLLALASGWGTYLGQDDVGSSFERLEKAGGLVDINSFVPSDEFGTPLIAAAALGNLQLVNQLLEHGARPDVEGHPDVDWRLPALSAIYGGQTTKYAEIALRLLDEEGYASLSRKSILWGRAFIVVCANGYNNEPSAWDTLAENLLKHGVIVNEPVALDSVIEIENENEPALYGSAIIAACTSGRLDLVKLLIAHGAHERPEHTGIYGSCLTAACSSDNPDMVRFWLDKGFNPRECTPGVPYWSPVVAACIGADDDDIISILLENECNPNITYQYQNDPVDVANVHESVSQDRYSWHWALLLRRKWNHTLITAPNLKAALPLMGNPVIAATSNSNDDYVLPALVKAGADIDTKGGPGSYPSAFFAVYDLKRQKRIYSWLLNHGAVRPSPEDRLDFIRSFPGLHGDDLSEHPKASKAGSFWGNMLSMAVVSHDLAIRYLLSRGADPEEVIPGSFYGSALIASAALLRGRVLKEFVESGANANHVASEGEFGTPLIAACAGPVANRFNSAFYKENNLNDPEEWEEVQLDIIEYLLDKGADPNVTYRGFSPLIVLVCSTSKLCYVGAKLLLDRGADLAVRLPKWGFEGSEIETKGQNHDPETTWTAKEVAKRQGDMRLLKLLSTYTKD